MALFQSLLILPFMKNKINPRSSMNNFKFSLKKLNCVFFIFLVLLFMSANIPGLDPHLASFILGDFRTVFIILALLSLSFILFESIQNKINSFNKNKIESRHLEDKLKSLNYDEKYILSLFINEQKTEKALSPTNPHVAWLEQMKFITNTSKNEGEKKIFRIDPTLLHELKKNPNLLY